MYKGFEIEYWPEDIASTLAALTGISDEAAQEVYDCIDDLKCKAENEYNKDCFRTMYKVLEKLVYAYETHSIQ